MQNQLSEESKNRFSGHVPDAECSQKMRDIRAAVRDLALKHHPDRGGDPNHMAEITRAYNEAMNTFLGRS